MQNAETRRGQSAADSLLPSEFRLLHFTVIDTGAGITREAQAEIFKPFQQAEAGLKLGGTGLGLAIARRLLDLMGGEIGVESEPGKGARFWFTVPLAPGADLKSEISDLKSAASARLKAGCKVKALVVDDVKENRELLSTMLANLGCEVLTANDGGPAVEAALSARPDIVFMDIRMPGMNGVEAVQRIKSALGNPPSAIKMVCLTASAFAHEREQYLATGFDDFIAKPFRFERIVECLERLLRAEFETTARDGAGDAAAGAEEWESFTVTEAAWQRLREAAERYSATRLEQGCDELQKLGGAGASLAAHLRKLGQTGDFEAVLSALDKVGHVD